MEVYIGSENLKDLLLSGGSGQSWSLGLGSHGLWVWSVVDLPGLWVWSVVEFGSLQLWTLGLAVVDFGSG